MRTGMLWFDDDPKRPLTEKIDRAVKRYTEKYGKIPNVVYANPVTIGEAKPDAHKLIALKTARSILPNHFWLGRSDD